MRVLIQIVVILAIATSGFASNTDELLKGVSEGNSARLSMLFEATIFSVDVANVEALLPPEVAEKIDLVVQKNSFGKEASNQIESSF